MITLLLSSHVPRSSKLACARRGESSRHSTCPTPPEGLPAFVLTALLPQACAMKKDSLLRLASC